MPKIYDCKRCGLLFERKQAYMTHTRRKNPCKQSRFISSSQEFKEVVFDSCDKGYTCEFCDKSYTRKASLSRHQRTDFECSLQRELKEDKKKIKKLEKRLDEKATHVTNYNNYVNVNINDFGKDELGFIDTPEFKKLFIETMVTANHNTYLHLIEFINLNSDYPQNMNISIANKKDGARGYILMNGIWESRKMTEILKDVIDDKRGIMERFESEIEGQMPEYRYGRYKKYVAAIDSEASKQYTELKKCIRDHLYDKRDIVKANANPYKHIKEIKN